MCFAGQAKVKNKQVSRPHDVIQTNKPGKASERYTHTHTHIYCTPLTNYNNNSIA